MNHTTPPLVPHPAPEPEAVQTTTESVSTPEPHTPVPSRPEPEEQSTDTAPDTASQTRFVVGLLVLALIIGGVSFYMRYFQNDPGRSVTEQTVVETPTDNELLAGFTLPEDAAVVAKVNNAEITGKEFVQQLAVVVSTAVQQGIDINNEAMQLDLSARALDTAINTELMVQAATAAAVAVAPAAITDQFNRIVASNGGPAGFPERLAESNMTEAELQDSIYKDILLRTYVEETLPLSGYTATAGELQVMYDEIKASPQGESLPEFTEVEDQIRNQVRLNKQGQAISDFITDLRAAASIETFLF